MRHPFLGLDDATYRPLWRALLVSTLVVYGLMIWTDLHYHTRAAPLGILSLQLARKPLMVRFILDQWSQTPGMSAWVGFGLGLDMLFIPLYSTLFGLVAVRIGETLGKASRGALTIGVGVAWLQWLGGAFDVVEDLVHIELVTRGLPEDSAVVAFGCALAKFAALGSFAAFALVGGLATRFVRPREEAPEAP